MPAFAASAMTPRAAVSHHGSVLKVENRKLSGSVFPALQSGNSVPVWRLPVAQSYAHPALTNIVLAAASAASPSGNCSRAIEVKGGKSNGFPSPFLSSELYGGMAYHNGED